MIGDIFNISVLIMNDDLGRWNYCDLRTGSGTVQLRPASGSIEYYK